MNLENSKLFSLLKLDLISNPKLKEFLRFVVVGVLATGIHYGIYLLLLYIINSNIAYTIGYLVSFVCNFFLSNFFTFKIQPTIKKSIGFGISHVINYLLHMSLLNLFFILGISKSLAPIPVYVIAIPVNFILVRFFFKSKRIN